MLQLDDGTDKPLGAVWDGRGVNFALFSQHASAVDLCLFDPSGRKEIQRFRLPCQTEHVWHGYVKGIRPGQLYGYRVHGPYDPRHGHRFNPHKLLVDPYARLFSGRIRWHDALFGYRLGSNRGDMTLDRRDSAPMMPKCVVIDDLHEWGDDRPPRHPFNQTVIYEAHVKGLTATCPDVAPQWRGTYAALGEPAVIDHLTRIGVTAIELMPIHAFVDDRFLVEKGLRNYWGYSTLGFFAPEQRYLGDGGIHGLKSAIRALHDADIEVMLDVVFNHTAEGSYLGPTLSMRGIDNAVYYKRSPDDPRVDWDSTGTGNTLDLSHPRVLQLALDSLRYWARVYHVDGFRFDLAPTLARSPFDFSQRAAFLQSCAQDPVLNRLKLIAEPWDVGPGGYQLGGFPTGWSEWNDRYRDTTRAFWRGDPNQLPALGQALTGSREIFQPSGRHPWASVNFVCSHDGYTLRDLVSYEERHNEANGENNQDGHGHNLSWNCGVEGPTHAEDVLALRARQQRNLMATTLLSLGVPMILMGDEMSRTQGGNNNAYCQDNDINWLDWTKGEEDSDLVDFVRNATALRRRFRAFRRQRYLTGATEAGGLKDIYWLAPEGREMTTEDWGDELRRAFGMQLGNDGELHERILILMNSSPDAVDFRAPDLSAPAWSLIFDTSVPGGEVAPPRVHAGGDVIPLQSRSLLVFQAGEIPR